MILERLPQHVGSWTFDVVDDELRVDGLSLAELASRAGRTPFYAYSRSAMSRRVEELRRLLPREVELHYAIKANPMPAVVQHLAAAVDGLDVASAGELAIALTTPIKRTEISFAGPGKSDAELAAATRAGIVINLESENEMRRLAAIARADGARANVAVRVNPDFELKTSGMKMSGGPKQFGVDAERVPAMLRELAALPLDFHGFHIFSGSQNLRATAIEEAQSKSVELALRLAADAPGPVRLLNIGGGFGIPYFPGEQSLDVASIGRHLAPILADVHRDLPQAKVIIELGRYLVGEAGIYVCRVVDRKISRGQVFLVTDGGLHHHLACSGNFGQVLRKNYPVLVGNHVHGTQREIVTVVGPLCTPLDLLADRMEMARADVGDYIVVLQSGAYGLTASPLNFLSHPPPGEIIV
jgi:diaminopimelate decarboxylase